MSALDPRARRLADPDRRRRRTRRRLRRFVLATGLNPQPWQWRLLARQVEKR